MSIRISSLLCIAFCLLVSCNNKKQGALGFEEFKAKFKPLELPLSWSGQDKVSRKTVALDTSAVKQFLNINTVNTFPIGSITKENYTAFIVEAERNETESSVLAIFVDNNGQKQGELVVGESTLEVNDHFGSVESITWSGNTIQRKIGYSYGKVSEPLFYEDVTTTIGADGKLTSTPEKIIPKDGTPTLVAHPVEIITYRSQEAKEFEITGIFPLKDTAIFLIRKNNITSLLSLTNDKQIVRNKDFLALSQSEEAEAPSGIVYAKALRLKSKNGKQRTFNQVMIKRSPIEIGESYEYDHGIGKGYGKIKLTKPDELLLTFDSDISTGEPDLHVCRVSGKIALSYNVGYYQGKRVEKGDDDCKLIFLFFEKALTILQVSSNTTCGCGTNAGYGKTYQLK
jgi:hypothetical protein